MADELNKRVNMNIIRYANCWEDADLLVEAIDLKKNGSYLSIGSSGDNSLSLLIGSPSLVVAVDLSPAQIACIELRKVLFQQLEYDEILEFLGINKSKIRIDVYNKIKSFLTENSRSYFDKNLLNIKKGIIHSGKFEHYFKLFRNFILPFILSSKKVKMLLNSKSEQERIEFYDKQLNTWLWRLLFKLFFNKRTMGKYGRDPEFFKYVNGSIENDILERTKYALTILPIHDNPYLEYIVTGNFYSNLPHYLRKENFGLIRNNIEKLEILNGSIFDVFTRFHNIKFDGFNLSDVFEYMSIEEYKILLERIIDYSNKGARLIYWNMQVDRYSEQLSLNNLKFLNDLSEKLFFKNKTFFYKKLIIEEIR